MQVSPDLWSGKQPQQPRGPQQQPQSQPQQFASPVVVGANPQQSQIQQQPIRHPTPQQQQQQRPQSASQHQQQAPGSSQVANQSIPSQPPHQPQQPAATNAAPPPSMQIPTATMLINNKALFMKTLLEIFRRKNLTGEDIAKSNAMQIDLFALFLEGINHGA